MWNGLYTAEKIIIQWTLLSEACYFAVQFLGDYTVSNFQYFTIVVIVETFLLSVSIRGIIDLTNHESEWILIIIHVLILPSGVEWVESQPYLNIRLSTLLYDVCLGVPRINWSP